MQFWIKTEMHSVPRVTQSALGETSHAIWMSAPTVWMVHKVSWLERKYASWKTSNLAEEFEPLTVYREWYALNVRPLELLLTGPFFCKTYSVIFRKNQCFWLLSRINAFCLFAFKMEVNYDFKNPMRIFRTLHCGRGSWSETGRAC